MAWIKAKKFAADNGYTRKQVYFNMRKHWPQGIVWSKAPNGRIYIDPDAVDAWVDGTLEDYVAAKPGKSGERSGLPRCCDRYLGFVCNAD